MTQLRGVNREMSSQGQSEGRSRNQGRNQGQNQGRNQNLNMRIGICEDQEFYSTEVINLIKKTKNFLDTSVKVFPNGEELLKEYESNSHPFDLVLMDIDLGNHRKSGLEVGKILRELDEEVILVFLSSHEECAVLGYEVEGFRFLVKPLKEELFFQMYESVKRRLSKRKVLRLLQEDREYFVDSKKIMYFEAQNKLVEAVCKGNKEGPLHLRQTIQEVEEDLVNHNFFRCHRSYLVNMAYIMGFEKSCVILEGDYKIPVSRMKVKKIQEEFFQYIRKSAQFR